MIRVLINVTFNICTSYTQLREVIILEHVEKTKTLFRVDNNKLILDTNLPISTFVLNLNTMWFRRCIYVLGEHVSPE